MKSGAILVLESVTKKLVLYKAMNEEQQLSMGRSIKWVDSHMPSKTSEELWYLCSNILTELSERDSVRYRIRATEASLTAKLDLIDEDFTHDSEGC